MWLLYSVTVKMLGCISAPTSVTINTQPATPAAPTAALATATCAVATGTITVLRLEGNHV
jgi:hypothetical protein